MTRIHSAAVLGAGVMGSAIAAHLANAGIRTLLLDMVPRDLNDAERAAGRDLEDPRVRNRLAREGIDHALKASPAAFAHRDRAKRVTPGNFEDDLDELATADWVVEAVVERLDVKTDLFARVVPHLKPTALLSTNTSGLSVNEMAESLPEEVRSRFFGTHFFNPPRYMHLLELIPSRDTDPARLEAFARFAAERLGKGVVHAKDTVNFIANRIGVFSVFYTVRAMLEHGLSVEAVDAITGPPLGRPKSATFRTADLVGLDVLAHVADNQYRLAREDEHRDTFQLPGIVRDLIEAGHLGEKSGRGFYSKEKQDGKTVILAVDPATGSYRPQEKVNFPVLGQLKDVEDPGARIATLLADKGPAGRFAWEVLAETLLYAARRIPTISDDVVSIDRALRWGFGWELGPFEIWDALGVGRTVERMEKEGREIPEAVRTLARSEHPSFYRKEGLGTRVWDFVTETHVELDPPPKVTVLKDLKASERSLFENDEASLIDLGDGVACLEFHSKMNAIGGGILRAIHQSLAQAEDSFDALVIGNQGENFSVGANLMLVLLEALEGDLPELDAMVRAFQRATMALKYARVPVVAAPFGRVLGGGAEICLHAHRLQASLETYVGLVEVGVGLVPAGGGTKELLLRAMAHHPGGEADPMPLVQRAFEAIGMAKVATSALEARDLGYLRAGDGVTMNPEHLIHDAKQAALALLETGWQPLHRPQTVRVLGRDGVANVRFMLHNMQQGGHISPHDALVGEKVGWILCGGEVDPGTEVSEDYLLDLERRAFVELCTQRKTLERIRHILKTGKPLRN